MESTSVFSYLFLLFRQNILNAPSVDCTVIDHLAVCIDHKMGRSHHTFIALCTQYIIHCLICLSIWRKLVIASSRATVAFT